MSKVVFLHPAHWEQAMGGAELQIFYLVQYFKDLGHKVHFIYEDQKTAITNLEKIELHPIDKIQIKGWFGKKWFLYTFQIYKVLRSINPDVVYTRSYLSWSGIAAAYCKKYGCKHVWAIASDNDVIARPLRRNILKPFNLIEGFYVNYSFKNSTEILTQNSFQKNTIQQRFKRNSIHVSKSCKIHSETDLVEKPELISIVWLANLKPVKRPEYFIELARAFKNKKVRFLMVGRMSDSYKSLIRDAQNTIQNFSYLGEIEIDKVHKLLGQSHILVNTSIYEALPNTFIEAWLNKVIVISMNVNPDNIIPNNRLGYICSTIDSLIEKVSFLIERPELISEAGERAQKYVKQNHDFNDYLVNIKNVMSL